MLMSYLAAAYKGLLAAWLIRATMRFYIFIQSFRLPSDFSNTGLLDDRNTTEEIPPDRLYQKATVLAHMILMFQWLQQYYLFTLFDIYRWNKFLTKK